MSEEIRVFAEDLVDFLNGVEASCVKLRKQVEKFLVPETSLGEFKAVLPELTFNILKFEQDEGVKLGRYEVAYRKANIPDKWNHAYSILRNNNALINQRFHEEGYVFAYWIFPEKYADRIFRKKLGGNEAGS